MKAAHLTTAEVATALGVTKRRVLQIAKARGIKPHRVYGQMHVWTASQVELLRPGPTGRPRNPR